MRCAKAAFLKCHSQQPQCSQAILRKSTLPHPEVIFEHGAVLVLNKPGGLLTQGPPGIDSLELRAKKWLIERENKPGKAYLGVPHRLDRPVSGAIVVVKNVRAAKRIAEQFRNRTVSKVYWAVVEGSVKNPSGTWKDWMRKVPGEARSEIAGPDLEGSKEAILDYRVLQFNDSYSLIEIQLQTGRTHQIRLQCSSRGLPIVGDSMYGSTTLFGPETSDLRKRWIALHAKQLSFEHPIEKSTVSCAATLSDHWDVFTEFQDDLKATT